RPFLDPVPARPRRLPAPVLRPPVDRPAPVLRPVPVFRPRLIVRPVPVPRLVVRVPRPVFWAAFRAFRAPSRPRERPCCLPAPFPRPGPWPATRRAFGEPAPVRRLRFPNRPPRPPPAARRRPNRPLPRPPPRRPSRPPPRPPRERITRPPVNLPSALPACLAGLDRPQRSASAGANFRSPHTPAALPAPTPAVTANPTGPVAAYMALLSTADPAAVACTTCGEANRSVFGFASSAVVFSS